MLVFLFVYEQAWLSNLVKCGFLSILDFPREHVASTLSLIDQVFALNLPLQFLRFQNFPQEASIWLGLLKVS